MAGSLHALQNLTSPSPLPPSPMDSSPTVNPPRPPNSWILYRAWRMKNLPPIAPGETRRNQSTVSTLVAKLWKKECKPVREYFERLAEEAKEEHKLRYPSYRYQPQKREDKKKGPSRKKTRKKNASSRGVSREAETSQASTQHRQSYHPYPSSARPVRDVYDHVGPSPPISAASSPSSSPSPLPLLSQSYTNSLPVDGALDLTIPATTFSHVENDTNISFPSTLAIYDYTQPSLDDIPHWETIDPMPPQQLLVPEWGASPLPPQNALYFDVPSHENGGWAATTFPCNHLPGQHDLNCLLADFPPLVSSEDQGGELEISVGAIPSGSPSVDQGPFSLDVGALSFGMEPPLFHDDPSQYQNFFFDIDSLSAFANNDDTYENFIPTTSQAPEVQSYVPPSGAAQSSTRRVGGSWPQYLQDLEATVHFEVSV